MVSSCFPHSSTVFGKYFVKRQKGTKKPLGLAYKWGRLFTLSLSLALGIYDAYKNQNISISKDTIFFGEIGLSGEVRQVNNMDNRLLEANKLGFKKAIIPFQRKKFDCNIEIIELKQINKLKKILI